MMDAMNQSFDLAAERGRPSARPMCRTACSTCSCSTRPCPMVMLGYTWRPRADGTGSPHGLVLVLLSLALVLILDLGPARSSGVQVSQQPLITLRSRPTLTSPATIVTG